MKKKSVCRSCCLPKWARLLFLASTIASIAGNVSAQVNDPYQSAARPFGLNIVDTVKQARSDKASAKFQTKDLVNLRTLALKNLPESKPLSSKTVELQRINPEQLFLQTAADVRCYFAGEGASYHSTLGFNTSGGGVTSGSPKLIFPDASTPVSYSKPAVTTGVRSTSESLLPGDFVNLGHMAKATRRHPRSAERPGASGRSRTAR